MCNNCIIEIFKLTLLVASWNSRSQITLLHIPGGIYTFLYFEGFYPLEGNVPNTIMSPVRSGRQPATREKTVILKFCPEWPEKTKLKVTFYNFIIDGNKK